MSKLLSRISGLFSKKRLAGNDPFGNKYFEEPGVHFGRSRRTVLMPGARSEQTGSLYQYDPSVIPPQWRAWLAHTRPDAPTVEEILEDMEYRKTIRERALELERQWQKRKAELMQNEEYRLLHAKVTKESKGDEVDMEGMLPHHHNHQEQPIKKEALPSGDAETFTPGEWTPQPRQKR